MHGFGQVGHSFELFRLKHEILVILTSLTVLLSFTTGSGWLTFLLGSIFDFHMSQLLDKMVAHNVKEVYGGERKSLLHMIGGEAALPAWTDVDLDYYINYQRPSWKKWLLRNAPKPTRQDVYYWFEVKGPKVYTTLFQIQMVFTAAYVSLLFLTILPLMVVHSEAARSERFFYLVLALFPVYLLLSKYQTAAANLTQACSIGVHRKPAAVSAVERDEKTAMIIMHLVTLLKLKQVAHVGFDVEKHKKTSTASAQDMEAARHIFEALDSDGSGEIAAEEIGELFEGLGTRLEEDTLDAIVKALDVDRSGGIKLEEFLDFYERYILKIFNGPSLNSSLL